MIVAVCVDDSGGMMFNHRRQSRDWAVIEDIQKLSSGYKLYIGTYSAKLFSENPSIFISNNFLELAGAHDFCFVEDCALKDYIEKIEKLILYRWNRKYPADTYFDLTLEPTQWHLESSTDFRGNSHEKITREVYVK